MDDDEEIDYNSDRKFQTLNRCESLMFAKRPRYMFKKLVEETIINNDEEDSENSEENTPF